jgi:hypothetical protein
VIIPLPISPISLLRKSMGQGRPRAAARKLEDLRLFADGSLPAGKGKTQDRNAYD